MRFIRPSGEDSIGRYAMTRCVVYFPVWFLNLSFLFYSFQFSILSGSINVFQFFYVNVKCSNRAEGETKKLETGYSSKVNLNISLIIFVWFFFLKIPFELECHLIECTTQQKTEKKKLKPTPAAFVDQRSLASFPKEIQQS